MPRAASRSTAFSAAPPGKPARGIGALRDAEVLLATHDRLFPEGGDTPLRAR
ncbi:MAG: hypothetical protein IE927_15370, partial [Rhodobacterales bacterium]|nr:hypothetical protein [Rhodobacterales bacterium]